MSSFEILKREIILLSDGETWEDARLEWELDDIHYAENSCLCTMRIWENCVIRNEANGNSTVVGNECIKRFLGYDFDPIFRGVRRVKNDLAASFGDRAVFHAFQKRWINNWEYSFYLSTVRKRSLSPKQRATRLKINEKILGKFTAPIYINQRTPRQPTPFDWPFPLRLDMTIHDN